MEEVLGNIFQPALPMRGVSGEVEARLRPFDISTRTPHAGSDRDRKAINHYELFQPALPMRGVTPLRQRDGIPRTYFNPHSPCGE